jgi:hypothetical protein
MMIIMMIMMIIIIIIIAEAQYTLPTFILSHNFIMNPTHIKYFATQSTCARDPDFGPVSCPFISYTYISFQINLFVLPHSLVHTNRRYHPDNGGGNRLRNIN